MKEPPPQTGWLRRLERYGIPAVAVGAVTIAIFVLQREWRSLEVDDVVNALNAVSNGHLALAALLTVAAYLVQAGYDALSLWSVGSRRRFHKVVGPALFAQVLSHNVGWSAFSGGSVRMRMYTAWGMPVTDVARVVVFVTLAAWIGYATVTGAWLLVAPPPLEHLSWNQPMVRGLGAAILLVPIAWIAGSVWQEQGNLPSWVPVLPRPPVATALTAIGVVDWLLSAAVLVLLLPMGQGPDLGTVLVFVLIAHGVGHISQSPGGLGVFEATLLLLLKPWFSTAELLGAALVLRLVYYLAPMTVAGAGLIVHFVARWLQKLANPTEPPSTGSRPGGTKRIEPAEVSPVTPLPERTPFSAVTPLPQPASAHSAERSSEA